MSTASFYLLETSKLDELNTNATVTIKKTLFSKKVTDNYWSYLDNNATRLKDFDGSGYIYANLIVFLLEERNIDLTQSEYDTLIKELNDKRKCSHFLWTNKQKRTFLNQLDTSKYSITELQKFNKDFSDVGDVETAKLTLNAIQILHDNLNEIQNDDHLLLLIVG